MWRVLWVPFAVQGAAMAVDELRFHRARGLPRWERIGHPLDTLTVLLCFAWIALVPFGPAALGVYVALAVASCACITKDEAVHATRCSPGEHWLHAVLFVLHPIVLGAAALLWPAVHGAAPAWLGDGGAATTIFFAELALTVLFGLYQTLCWNVSWQRHRAPST